MHVSGNAVQQVETFKCFEVAFTIDGRLSKEIHTRIVKAKAVMPEYHRSVFTKRELSNTAKAVSSHISCCSDPHL